MKASRDYPNVSQNVQSLATTAASMYLSHDHPELLLLKARAFRIKQGDVSSALELMQIARVATRLLNDACGDSPELMMEIASFQKDWPVLVEYCSREDALGREILDVIGCNLPLMPRNLLNKKFTRSRITLETLMEHLHALRSVSDFPRPYWNHLMKVCRLGRRKVNEGDGSILERLRTDSDLIKEVRALPPLCFATRRPWFKVVKKLARKLYQLEPSFFPELQEPFKNRLKNRDIKSESLGVFRDVFFKQLEKVFVNCVKAKDASRGKRRYNFELEESDNSVILRRRRLRRIRALS